MGKSMTKAQLVNALADAAQVGKKQIAQVLDTLAELACKEAKNGFMVPGIGKLVLVQRKARVGRNPQTGEPIKIPAKRVLKFRISKVIKDAMLKKK